MMRYQITLIIAILLSSPVMGFGRYQEDWYGGPDVTGPVTYWHEFFDTSFQISWAGEGSNMFLGYSSILHWIHSTGPGCDEMVVVDTDGDGDLDVVGVQFCWDRVSHWENLDGYGGTWARTIIADSLDVAFSIDAADIDLDGDADLVVGTKDGPFILENQGAGSWEVRQIGTLRAGSVRFADIDGDGDLDIGVAEGFFGANPNHVWWYENIDGYGELWEIHQVASGYNYPSAVRCIDLDQDGDLDLLVGSQYTPKQVVWLENADGAGGDWVEHIVCNEVSGPYAYCYGIEAGDLDGDGDNDIVATSTTVEPAGQVIWIENLDGLGTSWQKHPLDNDLVGANSVCIADLDGDGDMDVMATGGMEWGGDQAMWYENINGEASAWNGHLLDETTWQAWDITSCDLDRDGDPDVVVSDGVAGMRWYEFARAESGWLESSILEPSASSQVQFTEFDWLSEEPAGTAVTAQVRGSNDASSMGEWSPEILTPGDISQYIPEPCHFFQYRVNMSTVSPPSAPMVDRVTVYYDPSGIEGESGGEPSMTVVSGNPSIGRVQLSVYLPGQCEAVLSVHDLSGRLVAEPMSGVVEGGNHSLNLRRLPSGIYMIHLRASEADIREMVVVLD